MRSQSALRTVAVALIAPIIMAALSIWALSDRPSRFNQIPAGIVNLDTGAVLTQNGEDRFVPAGRLVVAELIHPTDDTQTFNWQILPPERATAGLQDGTLQAVVTIEADFSANLARLATPFAAPALITVSTNRASDALSAKLSAQMASAAAHISGLGPTRQLLEAIYLNFATLQSSLQQASQGAAELAVGADLLAGGVTEAQTAIDQLAQGADTLYNGATQLDSGLEQLGQGSRQLVGGLQKMRDEIAAKQLSPAQLKTADIALDAVRQLPDLGPVVKPALEALTDPQLQQDIHQAALQCQDLVSQVEACQKIIELDQKISALSPAEVAEINQTINDLSELTKGLDGERIAGEISTALDGPRQLLEAFDGSSKHAGLLPGAKQLDEGVWQLHSGAQQLAGGIQQWSQGADQLRQGFGQIPPALRQLGEGGHKLSAGLREGAEQIPRYTPAQARSLAQIGAEPIRAQHLEINPDTSSATAIFPLVSALCLWLAALGVFFVIPAVSTRRINQPVSSLRVVWSSLWRATTVGGLVALGILLVALLFGLSPARPLATFTLTLGAAAVFTAVLQALLSVFGPKAGRIIALVFLATEAATLSGILPGETAPGLLQSLGDILPLSVVSEGLSDSLLSDSLQVVLGPWMILAIWFGLSVLATTAAVSRQRALSALHLAEAAANR